MKKTLTLVCFALTGICSCKKTNHSFSGSLSGIYTEVSPMSGEMQLEFAGTNLMIKTETGSSSRDSFYYSISNNSISLTPAWTNAYPASPFYFQLLSGNSFKIQNLDASIPEAPESYMVFQK
jgi:hypothetical protein